MRACLTSATRCSRTGHTGPGGQSRWSARPAAMSSACKWSRVQGQTLPGLRRAAAVSPTRSEPHSLAALTRRRRSGRPVHLRLNASSAGDEYVHPLELQWMTRGGSSCPSTFSSSVRPSVASACRVSSGRRRGSLDQAEPLISITTCATWGPRVISHSQPRASTPVRACLPRLALISQLTTRA